MDGKEYLRSVVPPTNVITATSFAEYVDMGEFDTLEDPTNRALNDMLCLLFRDSEVFFITDDLHTIALSTGNAYNEMHSDSSKLVGLFLPRMSTVPRKNDDPNYTKIIRAEDTTQEAELVELTENIESAVHTSKARLAVFSAKILSDSLKAAFENRGKIKNGKGSIPGTVKGAISSNVRTVARDLGGAGFYVDITNDRDNTVGIEASPRSPLLSKLPNWLATHDKWDSAVQSLAAKGMLEFDVYTALVQWCLDREIGAIPVMAPPEFENRKIQGEKNTNADILLCSLLGNEVIPIQVKNSMPSEAKRHKYIKGMEFITPSNLGLVDMGNMPQKLNGRVRTVSTTTVHYGRLFSHFLNRFSGARTREQDMKALQQAYLHFDRVYLPKLKK